jgi:hypothetical protein
MPHGAADRLRSSLIHQTATSVSLRWTPRGAQVAESAVVVGPHSPPRWVYERAIHLAGPVAYGEPMIQPVGATDMLEASV